MDEYGLEKIEIRDDMTDKEKEEARQKMLKNLEFMISELE